MSSQRLIPLAQGVHGDVLLVDEEAAGRPALPVAAASASASADGKVLAAAAKRRVRKLVSAPKGGTAKARRPHDVVREVRILQRVTQPNIVALLAYTFDAARIEHTLVLPLLAFKLSDILASQDLRPHASELFLHTANGLFQALAYLHARGIAHRDVNPRNVMFSFEGVPVLIDFGAAWDGEPAGDGGTMSCAVGTGPYRAPELLFSPVKYDAAAIDLWSAGVTLAEFFYPFRRGSGNTSGNDSSSDSDDEGTAKPPSRPKSESKSSDPVALEVEFARLDVADKKSTIPVTTGPPSPLFSSAFGELGLAASIFRLLGTPSPTSWPSFTSLPDAGKIAFDQYPPQRVRDALSSPPAEDLLDVLEALVQLEPTARRSAAATLTLLSRLNRPPPPIATILGPFLLDMARRRTTAV